MEDFNSKYSGEQVESLLDMVANGEVGGGIEAETDPVFSASPAATITDAKKAEWDGKQDAIADLATIRSGAEKGATALQSVPSEYGTKAWVTEQARDIANDAVGDFEAVAVEPLAEDVSQLKGAIGNKVDKVTGKGLSAEDFTSAFKSKLEGLSNYDDTELSEALATLREDFDKLVSGDTTTAIKTFNEVIAFLDGIADTEDLAGIIASIEQQIAGKMDNVTLAKVATSGSYNDLSDKPIASHGSLMFVEVNGIADDYAYYALPTSTTNFADEDDVFVTRNTLKTINGESLVGSGDITISGGATLTEEDIAAMGFTKNTGTYSKPSGGIPKSDLTSAVQTSLGKADTALQSYTEQYKGTITGVSANGTSVATSGVANIPAASTSVYGVTKLSSSTSSTSTTLAATASAVKSAYDLANSYKGTVTGVKVNGSTKSPSSGTVDIGNVVTSVKLNGTTYSPSSGVVDLGSVSGGSSSGGSAKEVVEVVASSGVANFSGISPDKVYICKSSVSQVNISISSLPTETIAAEYTIIFESSYSGISVSVPSYTQWANGEIPVFEGGKRYEMSLRAINWSVYTSYYGVVASFDIPNFSGGDND